MLAEQLIRFGIGIGEVLAFHSAVFEKADMEKLPLEAAAYRIVEDMVATSAMSFSFSPVQTSAPVKKQIETLSSNFLILLYKPNPLIPTKCNSKNLVSALNRKWKKLTYYY